MLLKNKKEIIQDTYAQDDKVERNKPNFTSFKQWLAYTYMGYKDRGDKKLKLKKSPTKSQIYDGDLLIASYDNNGNFFWLGQPTLRYEIFGVAQSLKKQKKDEFNSIDESFFEVEEVEDVRTQEDIDKEFLEARGKMAAKIRNLFIKAVGENSTFRLQVGNEVIDADADQFVDHVKESFKQQFNKYGLKLAEWILDGTITDKNLKIKRRLLMALNQLVKADNDKYNENFNGLTVNQLLEEYAGAVKAAIRKEKEEINNMPVENKGYTIVRIKDKQHAESFKPYVDRNDGWCITTRGAYNNYVDPLSGKAEVFYLLLKNGYEKLTMPSRGDRKPFDEYALSMIMVSVRQDGSIQTATSRYNHIVRPDSGTPDSFATDLQLSQIIGKSIYKACPPLSSPIDLLRDIKTKGISYLKGESKGFKREVKYYGGFLYILENGQIMTDTWDSIIKFNSIVLVKSEKGNIDSDTIGYILIQKLLKDEGEINMNNTTEDFFIGMDMGLNIVYGPTKKGDVYSTLGEVRKAIKGD